MGEILDILHKKLRNETLTRKEEIAFGLWLSSAANQELYNDYKKVWSLTGSKSKVLNPNVEMQWEKFKTIRNNAYQPKSKIIQIYKVVAAIAAIFILVVGVTVVINTHKNSVNTYATEASILELKLPDNSIVFLNKNSTLVVSKDFNKRTRTVILNGEALFEVKKNQSIPFIVEMENGLLVKVLGTTFNLKTNGDASLYELRVLAGKVLFEKAENGVVVEKNEEVNFNSQSNTFSESKPIDRNLLAWHTKTFEFDNSPISDVVLSFERFLNTKIELPQNIGDVRYSGTFNNPNEQEIAEILSLALGWDYKINKDTISFTQKELSK